jgi:hypothetical protein
VRLTVRTAGGRQREDRSGRITGATAPGRLPASAGSSSPSAWPSACSRRH